MTKSKIIKTFYADRDNSVLTNIKDPTLVAVFENGVFKGVTAFKNNEDIEKYIIKNAKKKYKMFKI